MFSCGNSSSALALLLRGRVVLGVALARHGAPQIVEHLLLVLAALARALFLGAQVHGAAARVAVHAVAHQRVRGVQQALDLRLAVSLLAVGRCSFLANSR